MKREASKEIEVIKSQGSMKKITPELVKAISERVYALLQADLRRERERARLPRRPVVRS